jgi:hypothetical protein
VQGRCYTWRYYCWGHDPVHADERRRNASKGGRSGGQGRPAEGELAAIRAQLKTMTDQVLAGSLDRSAAIAANLILNTRLRAMAIERKMKEAEELDVRLEALEEWASENKRWR